MVLNIRWKNENATPYLINADNLHGMSSGLSAMVDQFLVCTGQRELTLAMYTDIKLINLGTQKVFSSGTANQVMPFDATTLDTGTIAGSTDYYVYLCDNEDGTASIKISANSTFPSGYTADNTRKIGGFHTLCADVGTITGHPLADYIAGDILPQSVWCLTHRSEGTQEGTVWSDEAKVWADIYLQSGTGSTTASANGATITDTRMWFDHVDDLGAVGKRLLFDHEFQLVAAGSNEETSIANLSDPVTTGGHIDKAGRRMISNIGCEDCCGVQWQWIQDLTHRHDTITTYGWAYMPGSKGRFYRQGFGGPIRLVSGGYWLDKTFAGSRSRNAQFLPWTPYYTITARGCARMR